ncbi:hypothetical protein DYU11_21025 [Fibrisoma montanum]|uniref:Uncharacterized protein n=1 Tax=Fibrisoma montanum TaxID=2305895 RepID=A0A418M460_9BACT|nr:hypothetical protein [Fibrisoma montanum]RIV20531.1 hypothetical protein DYU11_21025 [Fibrisoma montanum]
MSNKAPTTDEAFAMLMTSDYYWSFTGLSHQHKRVMRVRWRKDQVSAEKKEELLEKAGFCIKQEKLWQLPE